MQRQLMATVPNDGRLDAMNFAQSSSFDAAPPPEGVTLGSLLSLIRARWLVFSICLLLSLGAGSAIIMSLKRSYRSEALIAIEPNATHVTNLQSIQDSPPLSPDLAAVWSQIQILQSDSLARKVVTALHLDTDPAFAAQPPPWRALFSWARLPGWLLDDDQPEKSKSSQDILNETVARYSRQFNAFNDGKSYIVSVSFSASTPTLARQILTEHLKLYLEDQTAAKERVINKADAWFQGQLSEMQDQLQQAETKAQLLRGEHHLLRTGQDEETIAGRQLAAVTAQLADAKADLARKQARYREMTGPSGASRGQASDSTVLSSPLIQRLREQEATAAQHVAELQRRGYQPNSSMPLMSAQAALDVTRKLIADEIHRMTAAALSDVQVAQANTDQLQQSVTALESQLGETREAELRVNQLARSIHADSALYEDLLSRSRQVAVQKQIQTPDARVVSEPTEPFQPSFPRYKLLFAVAATAAALVSVGILVLLDKIIGKPSWGLDELEATYGLVGLGSLPLVRRSQRRMGGVVDPNSQLGASLLAVATSINLRCDVQQPGVVAFASALPGDGKTFVATTYAQCVASRGRRVLLIDTDLRRSRMARMLGKQPLSAGTLEVLQGKRELSDAVRPGPVSGLDILPVAVPGRAPAEILLHPERMTDLVRAAQLLYDVIVIDTAPLAVVDDAMPLVTLADATVMVVRWGRTHPRFIQAAMRRLLLARTNVVGAVLNGVDSRKMYKGSVESEAFRLYSRHYFPARP